MDLKSAIAPSPRDDLSSMFQCKDTSPRSVSAADAT